MSEVMKISVDRREKRIEVNDQGDFIVLPVGNPEFVSTLMVLLKDFDAKAAQQRERAQEIQKMPEDTTQETMERLTAAASFNLEISHDMAERVNALFGKDACLKVFGSNAPSLYMFADFFDQLTPYIRQFAEEEAQASQERIRKYSNKYTKKYHSADGASQ